MRRFFVYLVFTVFSFFSPFVIAGDRYVTGMKFSDASSLDLIASPQSDGVILATFAVSSIKFPIAILSEQGNYWYVRVGGKSGWVKKFLVDVSDQSNRLETGLRQPPKPTNSTQGIEDGSDPNANKATVDGAANQVGQELLKAMNLPK